jgi:hypothetical protein
MEQHGRVRWHDIANALADQPSYPRLTCYWAFAGCGYRKGIDSCANPDHQPACPLPRHDLRDGRLNQTAYSRFLFMRDLAGGDIVGWIDNRLAGVDLDDAGLVQEEPGEFAELPRVALGAAALVGRIHIYGVSNKVLAMALADLRIFLLATIPAKVASPHRQQPFRRGGSSWS